MQKTHIMTKEKALFENLKSWQMSTEEFKEMSTHVSERVIAWLFDAGEFVQGDAAKAREAAEGLPENGRFTDDEKRFCYHTEHLIAEEIASLFGITPSAVSQWKGAPRNMQDGKYNFKVIRYWRESKKENS
jgi:hypothetical protein